MSLKKLNLIVILAVLISSATFCFAQNEVTNDETELIDIMHSISSHKLYDYIAELSDDKFEGRLTGTEGYDLAAEWFAEKFISLGVTASGENESYFQYFDIPYTLVFPGSEVILHIPYKKSFARCIAFAALPPGARRTRSGSTPRLRKASRITLVEAPETRAVRTTFSIWLAFCPSTKRIARSSGSIGIPTNSTPTCMLGSPDLPGGSFLQ